MIYFPQKTCLQQVFTSLRLIRLQKTLNLNCSYNPHKNRISDRHDGLSKYLDLYSSQHESVVLSGHFNVGIHEKHMKSFCDNYNLRSLIKLATCYKNPYNTTCIDLILKNLPRKFYNTCVLETGLSDIHLIALTTMRKSFKKSHPKFKNYCSYENFLNETFRESLL